jgi:hypothetical protein
MNTANRFTLTFGDYLKLKDQWYYAKNAKIRFNPGDNFYGSNWQVLECFKVDKDFKVGYQPLENLHISFRVVDWISDL